MNQLARILLLVGALVLALLVGILIGRGQQHAFPTEGNTQAVQITTQAPPLAEPPLHAPTPPPQPAPPRKVSPDLQVQEDAAAVGMTTKNDDRPAPPQAPAPDASGQAGNAQPAD